VYLCALDHWITRQLRPLSYLRYMDDLTLPDTDPERLQYWIEPINRWLQLQRQQSLNPSISSSRGSTHGLGS
jgi:hypothetical protein